MVRVKDRYRTIQEYHRFNVMWLHLTELRKHDRHYFTQNRITKYTNL